MEIIPVVVGWPADRRNEIPPSLIFEFQSYSCSRCDAELADAHDGPKSVRQERDKAFERHWHKA
jgi:hypothetical protein